MQRSYYERQDRKARQTEEAKECDLGCTHLESYRTEAAANRALDRIKNFEGFANSKQFPQYAYLCPSVACMRWHLSAQPAWMKGQIESGLSEEEWYSRTFGDEMGWVDV